MTIWFGFSSGQRTWVAHLELAHALVDSGFCAGLVGPVDPPVVQDPRSAAAFASEMLSFYGPRTLAQIEALLPPAVGRDGADDPAQFSAAEGAAAPGSPAAGGLAAWLAGSDAFIAGQLVEGSDEIHLLRPGQIWRRCCAFNGPPTAPRWPPNPCGNCRAFSPLGRASVGLGAPPRRRALEKLCGYAAPVAAWLHDFLSARFEDFSDHLLDEMIVEQQLAWLGVGKQQITLCYAEELPLQPTRGERRLGNELTSLFLDRQARYGYHQLSDRAAGDSAQFNEFWWRAVWAGAIAAGQLGAFAVGRFAELSAWRSRGLQPSPRPRRGPRVAGQLALGGFAFLSGKTP